MASLPILSSPSPLRLGVSALPFREAIPRPPLEISLALLLFHAAGFVVVDHSALAFAVARDEHFLDDLGEGRRGAFDGAGQGVAAEGSEADALGLGLFAGAEVHAV